MDGMELTNRPRVHDIVGDDGPLTITVYAILFFDAIQAILEVNTLDQSLSFQV